MSKPNLLGFSSSLGIYRNKRMMDLEASLGSKVKRQVPFSKLAPMLFQMVMAYAGENQIDGDFSGYRPEDFRRIFSNSNLDLTVSEAKTILAEFEAVGLFENGKIRSWGKYNRHLAKYEADKKAKIKAGKERQAKARAAQNGKPHSAPADDGYGIETRTSSATAKVSEPEDKRFVEWNGKSWFISDLRGEVKRLEQQIVECKKRKPSVSGTANEDSHNVWLTELNKLEKIFADALGKVQGRHITPIVHSAKPKSKVVTSEPAPLSETELLESAQFLVSIGKADSLTASQKAALKKAEVAA